MDRPEPGTPESHEKVLEEHSREAKLRALLIERFGDPAQFRDEEIR